MFFLLDVFENSLKQLTLINIRVALVLFFINSKKQLSQKNKGVIKKSHRDFNFIINQQ